MENDKSQPKVNQRTATSWPRACNVTHVATCDFIAGIDKNEFICLKQLAIGGVTNHGSI
jgi:hypothetical protein